MSCARLGWPSPELLSARKYTASYYIVSYRIVSYRIGERSEPRMCIQRQHWSIATYHTSQAQANSVSYPLQPTYWGPRRVAYSDIFANYQKDYREHLHRPVTHSQSQRTTNARHKNSDGCHSLSRPMSENKVTKWSILCETMIFLHSKIIREVIESMLTFVCDVAPWAPHAMTDCGVLRSCCSTVVSTDETVKLDKHAHRRQVNWQAPNWENPRT